jgi:hypothetical protein
MCPVLEKMCPAEKIISDAFSYSENV